MQGRTRCPYCNKNVVVEVPDGATGIQRTTCPNCGMHIKVDVNGDSHEKREEESPIHPLVKDTRSNKPTIAGIFLIIVFLLGIIMGVSLLLSEKEALQGNGIYEGAVVDVEHNPIEGASIYLMDEGLKVKIAETDAEGYFSINLSSGKHRILIEKDGYISKNVSIGVFPIKSIFRERFVLEKGEGEEKERSITAFAIDILPMMAVAIIIISIPSLIGGIFCFIRKYRIIAVVGAVFGIFSVGFFIGTVLSIVALILILMSKEDFGRV